MSTKRHRDKMSSKKKTVKATNSQSSKKQQNDAQIPGTSSESPTSSTIILKHGYEHINVPSNRFSNKAKLEAKNGLVSFVQGVQEECSSSGGSKIKAQCRPQERTTIPWYNIQIDLDKNRDIVGGKCSCKAGDGARCKHGYAVVEQINSSTDKTCTSYHQKWGNPGKKYEAKKASEMFTSHSKRKPYDFKVENADKTFLEEIKKNPLWDSKAPFVEMTKAEEKIEKEKRKKSDEEKRKKSDKE